MKLTLLSLAVLLTFACGHPEQPAAPQAKAAAGSGDAARGKEALQRYGCQGCHIIPGIDGPRGMVGPSLEQMATRQINGKIPNTPENMARWIENPQSVDPQATMPNLSVTPADAQDITAFIDR